LSNIATYGFRGEALASISHVARLSILTKTRESKCGFKAEYSDGKMKGSPKPMAANQGTTISVEDLFFNVPNRLAALRSSVEEFNKISEVMTRYAVHNAGVGFTLKKAGETSVTVKTQSSNSILDNIRLLYGPSVAKELIEFEFENERYKVKSSGYISNVNYSVRKMVFLLFINHRLVESTAIKKSIESVYAAYLPKGMSPFVYLSLEIHPNNVDVNVHPTKHEVFFLNQDSIIEKFQSALEQKLLNSNASRTFYTERLLPESKVPKLDIQKSSTSEEKSIAAKDMIRTSSTDQKLDRFLVSAPSSSSVKDSSSLSVESVANSSKSVLPDQRACKLSSVNTLRKELQAEASLTGRDIFANHTFVGCVSRKLALFQHSTKLYLVNTHKFSEQLFTQILLRDFGNIGVIKLNPAPSVNTLARLALDHPEAGWSPEDGDKKELADFVTSTLFQYREMLDDYFSLQLDYRDGVESLVGLPLLLDDYCPWLAGLPLFILRLATEVDYQDEIECFRGFIRETARFYAVSNSSGARMDLSQHERDKKHETLEL
jgi:DNA mismatch repair protein MLH1